MRMRTPLAYLFDRNCVLAATAGQIAAAVALDCEIAAVIVGQSPFDIGFVAKDIRLADPKPDAKNAAIAAAGTLSFAWAALRSTAEACDGLSGPPLVAMQTAEAILLPLVADGRLAAMVRRLNRLTIPGEWQALESIKELAA